MVSSLIEIGEHNGTNSKNYTVSVFFWKEQQVAGASCPAHGKRDLCALYLLASCV